MRIATSAAAIVLLTVYATSASHPKITFSTTHFGLGSDPNLIIPYGGDSSSATPHEVNENATTSTENSQHQSTSSKLLSTVSAGGAFHSETAFVGTKTRVKSPPYGSGETYRDESSLPVATNQQATAAAVGDDTSSDEETSSVASDKPLRAVPKNNGPLKILFLSSDTGGGHRASAEALANQFQRLYPGTTYDLFDVWTDVETSWPY